MPAANLLLTAETMPSPNALPCVARAQTAREDARDERLLPRRDPQAAGGADDVGVHAGAADLLAHLVDDQQVDVGERQPRQHALGQRQQLDLGRLERLGWHETDDHGLVVLVLDDGDGEEDVDPGEERAGDGEDRLAEPARKAVAVVLLGPRLLAEADGQHLERAALDRSDEVGVRLDPVDEDDSVGLEGVAVEVQGDAAGFTEHRDLHGRAHRRAHALGRDAAVGEHLGLPLGRRAAVGAHGGHDEGLESLLLQLRDDVADGLGQAADAAAADGDRHLRPTGERDARGQRLPLVVDLARGVDGGGHRRSAGAPGASRAAVAPPRREGTRERGR